MADNDKSQSRMASLLQIGALVIGVLTILVTIIFSIRAERTKEISITNLTKRPLVSIEGGRRSVGLEITAGGNRLDAPWLLSGRLANTGNQAIEERDIEMPAHISFSRGKIIGAEIAKKSQPAIFAQATIKGNDIVINHKLLNPGEWLEFDLLFDGEPDVPTLSFRISGVSQPQNIIISPDQKRIYSTIVPLPLPIIYLLLVIGSVISIVIMGGGLFILSEALGRFFKRRNEKSYEFRLENFYNRDEIIKSITASSQKAQIVLIALGKDKSWEWLDKPGALIEAIRTSVPSGLLESVGLTVDGAAELLRGELRESFKESLHNILRLSLLDVDKAARDEFLKLDVNSMTTTELLEKAKAIEKTDLSRIVHKKLDVPGLLIGFLCVKFRIFPDSQFLFGVRF